MQLSCKEYSPGTLWLERGANNNLGGQDSQHIEKLFREVHNERTHEKKVVLYTFD